MQLEAPPRTQAASPWRFRIHDAAGQPLAGADWAVHQGTAVWRGKLDARGDSGALAALKAASAAAFDPAQAFRLHVPGYACCIASGAAIVAHDSAVEYGGQWFDWRRAAEPAFWAEYDAARRRTAEAGVFQFMQHDHVMRRPLRALGGAAPVVFEARPLAIRLGPLVRYTDDDEALIWLELQTPALVRVRYGRAASQTNKPKPADVPAATEMRHACSVRVGGRHYAMVTLDALAADTAYQYTVELAPQPASGALPSTEAEFIEAVFPRTLPQAALGPQQRALERLTFNGSHWPTLRTLPRETQAVRFAHGSCRKWPDDADAKGKAPGPDMLDAFGRHFLSATPWNEWPHFLLHTGDQIYADDVGVRLGKAIVRERNAAVVAGPAPARVNDVAFGAWAGRFGNRYLPRDGAQAPARADLEELRRHRLSYPNPHVIETAIARAESALAQHVFFDDGSGTKAAAGKPVPMRHKLRVRNRLLWEPPVEARDIPRIDLRQGLQAAQDFRIDKPAPRTLRVPYPAAGDTGGVHAADFAEYAALYEQAWGTFETRRALAHLPSYMIFDDHEVTDDWNADAGWLAVVNTPRDPLQCWPATITDALASYWVYQGWGNLSPRAAHTDPRVEVLERARRSGRDALPELRRLIFERAVRPTAKGADRRRLLAWNFSIPTGGTPMLVVDLRTDRDVHGSGGMSRERLDWLEAELRLARGPAAFIVLPVPYLLPAPMLWAMRHAGFTGVLAGEPSTAAFRRHSDIEHPAANFVGQQIILLLRRLQARPIPLKTVVIVSGDIHFSCNLDGQLRDSKGTPRLLQLVSSGLRQVISESKQNKMKSAYQGTLNTVGGSEGVDTGLAGFTITVGGMQGPDQREINYLYPTSFAIVDYRGVAAGQGRAPVIVQTHYTMDGKNGLTAWRFRHMTQPNGSALMTLHDPGPSTKLRPSTYPAAKGGLGFVKEAGLDETGEAGQDETELFEPRHVADESTPDEAPEARETDEADEADEAGLDAELEAPVN